MNLRFDRKRKRNLPERKDERAIVGIAKKKPNLRLRGSGFSTVKKT